MIMNGKMYPHKGTMKGTTYHLNVEGKYSQTYGIQDTPNDFGGRPVNYEKAAKAQPPFSDENVTSVEQPYGSKMKMTRGNNPTQQRKY